MRFYINQSSGNNYLKKIINPLIETLGAHGFQLSAEPKNIQFVLNLTDVENPTIFKRRSKAVFVVSVVLVEAEQNLRTICYQTLVRTLSNLLICIVLPRGKTLNQSEVYFTTPEAGFYRTSFNPQSIYEAMKPVIGAHYAIDNILESDLPSDYWEHSQIVEQIRHFGRELDALGVLPAPFPLQEFLTNEDLQHLYKLFQVKGLSYGNLSAREQIKELGDSTFWMTARGINKAEIGRIGQDVLLVKGLDKERGVVKVSVPPVYDVKARVSVDAAEHFLIYRTFKNVGAIVHVHAWMEDVLSTRQNYPCGTIELAREVVHLLKQTSDPAHAVVGLKNHGLTITGANLEEIFQRIKGKLIKQVPMVA